MRLMLVFVLVAITRLNLPKPEEFAVALVECLRAAEEPLYWTGMGIGERTATAAQSVDNKKLN